MRKSYRTVLKMLFLVALALLFAACADNNNNDDSGPAEPPVEPIPPAPAREITDAADLLQGPLARNAPGDFVLENELLRVIIQRPGRRWLGIGVYGGNIIDASARKADGTFYPDHLEEFVVGVNIENTPNYTEVRIVNDGSDGAAAVICASGPDDLLDFVNASSAIRGLGFSYPSSADDRDLPLDIETCYSLAAGERYVTMDTTLTNTSSEDLPIYQVEYLNGSGQVEAFQPLVGFGEPQLSPVCPATRLVACSSADDGLCDQCNYLAYSGVDGALGVSYGLIHEVPGSSSFSSAGVNILVLGRSVLNFALGLAPPNFTVPADGELSLVRYFAVGDGSASSIGDIRNQLFGIETGELNGQVSSAGEPLVAAQVAVYQTVNGDINPPALFMAGHTRTDTQGNYSLTLPPGVYEVRANMEGYLFDSDGPATVSVPLDAQATQNFDLPAPGQLEVSVTDQFGPIPAKLQLVGFDPSPPLRNAVFTSETGVFGDVGADALPYGIALADFIDRDGSSGPITVEPGDYQLLISRGPRYSVYKELITIVSGQTTSIQAQIARVVESPGLVHGDFHVHSIDSPDSEVTREERVAVYLAEGMDFFTPSDHGARVDFSETIQAMGVADLIGTTTSSETTTFDYGHFNSWPLTIDPDALGGGGFDWGREAPAGMDFPEYGSYVLSPREVIEGLHADPKDNVVQINHIGSHFGSGGLAIDTGQTPPQSSANLAQRRLDPTLGNAFDDGFDSLEVWIGTNGRSGIVNEFLGANAGDWFNLINQGIVRTGVANSDSHDRRFTRISARNLIASDITDPAQLGAIAEQLAATVKAGKTIGTNAPVLWLHTSGPFNGASQSAGLGMGESTGMPLEPGASLTVTLDIATPGWAPLDTVEFYINSQPQLTSAAGDAARYGICANAKVSRGDALWSETEVVVDAAIVGATRTEISVSLSLPAVTEDTWVLAIAKGSDGVSEPLFPVLPASLDTAGNTTLAELTDGNLGEGGTPAFAFTNPLFIDVGGDGWVPPGVQNAACVNLVNLGSE